MSERTRETGNGRLGNGHVVRRRGMGNSITPATTRHGAKGTGKTRVQVKDFDGSQRPTWCPGCGDFAILTALKRALAELQLAPHEVMIISGIGCGSKLPNYIRANGFMTIHGRPLAVATGFRLANPFLTTIVVNGDGDAYGIGGNHFLHTLRRNINLTHIVQNNQIYALTKGQYSPTSHQGFVTTTSPDGAPEQPVLPTALAFTGGAGFIARASAGRPQHMADIFAQAIRYPGYALVDVLQPCVTFNKLNTYEWFDERTYDVAEEPDYDPTDSDQAWRKVQEWGDRIPLGVLYRVEQPTYEERVSALAKHGAPCRWYEKPLDPAVFEELKEQFM